MPRALGADRRSQSGRTPGHVRLERRRDTGSANLRSCQPAGAGGGAGAHAVPLEGGLGRGGRPARDRGRDGAGHRSARARRVGRLVERAYRDDQGCACRGPLALHPTFRPARRRRGWWRVAGREPGTAGCCGATGRSRGGGRLAESGLPRCPSRSRPDEEAGRQARLAGGQRRRPVCRAHDSRAHGRRGRRARSAAQPSRRTRHQAARGRQGARRALVDWLRQRLLS